MCLHARALVCALALQSLLAWNGPPVAWAGEAALHSEPVTIQRAGQKLKVRAINVPTLELLDAILAASGLEVTYYRATFRQRARPTYASYVTDGYEEAADVLRGFCAHNGLAHTRTKDGGAKIGNSWAAILAEKDPKALIAEHTRQIRPIPPETGGIETGFVLFHGHYVPPPYKFEVTDKQPYKCTIRLNGMVFTTSGFVPITLRKPVPLPPSGVFESKRDALFYFFQNFQKWEREEGREKALERTRRFFMGPPYDCRAVKFYDKSDDILLQGARERDDEVINIPDAKKTARIDPQVYAKSAERHIQELSAVLRRGGLIALDTRAGKKTIPAARAVSALRRLVAIAQAKGNPFAKDRAVLDVLHGYSGQDVSGHSRALSWDIQANFRLTPALAERLRGVQP